MTKMKKEEAREKAIKICELLQEGKLTRSKIARKVGCSTAMVYDIIRGRSHVDISQHYTWSRPYTPSCMLRPKLPDETVHKICKLLSENIMTRDEIATECGVSITSVANILNKKSHTDISDQYDFPVTDSVLMNKLINDLGGFDADYFTFVEKLETRFSLLLKKVKDNRIVYFSNEEKAILRLVLGVLMEVNHFTDIQREVLFDVRKFFAETEEELGGFLMK